jgi:hypothetical protein
MSNSDSTDNIPDAIVDVKTRFLNRLGTQAMTSVHTRKKAKVIDDWVKENMDIFDKVISEAYEKGLSDS